jgi:hypothetical protein
MNTWQERHSTDVLPPMPGQVTAESSQGVHIVAGGESLLSVTVQGKVLGVTEAEGLSIIGQLTAQMQAQKGRAGVQYNGS